MQDCCEMNPSNKLLGKMFWSCSTSMMEGEASHIYIYIHVICTKVPIVLANGSCASVSWGCSLV